MYDFRTFVFRMVKSGSKLPKQTKNKNQKWILISNSNIRVSNAQKWFENYQNKRKTKSKVIFTDNFDHNIHNNH